MAVGKTCLTQPTTRREWEKAIFRFEPFAGFGEAEKEEVACGEKADLLDIEEKLWFMINELRVRD